MTEERAVNSAMHIIKHRTTVRATAKATGVSKSTVQTDVTISNGLFGR